MYQIDRHDTFIEGPLYQSRKKLFPQSVSGRFRSIKWRFMAFALGLYYLLPFVRWDRGPGAPNQAVLLDLPIADSISSSSNSGLRKSIISPAF